MAYPKSTNPFADDDDDNDEQDFKPKSTGYGDDPDSGLSEAERRQRYLQQEVMRTAQSAVDSSYRSLSHIYESEKMGVETAEVCSNKTVESGFILSLNLSLFASLGAHATGWGFKEDEQNAWQHGSEPEYQPEAH